MATLSRPISKREKVVRLKQATEKLKANLASQIHRSTEIATSVESLLD
jgi:hypothetical protein